MAKDIVYEKYIRERTLKNGAKSLSYDLTDIPGRPRGILKGLKLYPGLQYKDQNEETKRKAVQRVLAIRENPNAERSRINSNSTFIEYAEKIKESHNHSIKTYENYQNLINKIKSHPIHNRKISKVDQAILEDFLKTMSEGLKNSSVKQYWAMIKTIINHAIRNDYLNSNPVKNIKTPKVPEKIPEYLTESEVKILYQDYSEHPKEFKRAFLFSCYTGLRISDIESLKFTDISDHQIKITQRKTKSNSYIPLNGISEQLLNTPETDITGKVFSLPIRQTIRNLLIRWFESTGIQKRAFYHISRHTFAVWLIAKGVDIYTVSKLLGHKDLKSTQVYAEVLQKNKQEAINRLAQ